MLRFTHGHLKGGLGNEQSGSDFGFISNRLEIVAAEFADGEQFSIVDKGSFS